MEKNQLHTYQEYSDERFTKRVIYKTEESVVFILNFMPGQQLPRHNHPGTHVFLLILEGTGTMIADDQEVLAMKGDLLKVDGEEQFAIRNDGDQRLSIHVMLNKIPDERYAKDV